MRFLIMNQHTLNFGDDIAGYSVIQQILKKFPEKDTSIEIVYNTPGSLGFPDERVVDRRDISLKDMGSIQIFIFIFFSLFGIKLVYKNALKKLKHSVQAADMIIVAPGGANLGIYKDWRFLLKLYLVTALDGQVVFHNNTVNFSGNLFFDFLERRVLKHSRLYVRELKSFDMLDAKGYFPIRGVDTAFSFGRL